MILGFFNKQHCFYLSPKLCISTSMCNFFLSNVETKMKERHILMSPFRFLKVILGYLVNLSWEDLQRMKLRATFRDLVTVATSGSCQSRQCDIQGERMPRCSGRYISAFPLLWHTCKHSRSPWNFFCRWLLTLEEYC